MKYASEAYLSYGALKFVQQKGFARTNSANQDGPVFTAVDLLESAHENMAMLSSHILELKQNEKKFYEQNPVKSKENNFLITTAVKDKFTKYMERVLLSYFWDYMKLDPIRETIRNKPLIDFDIFKTFLEKTHSSIYFAIDYQLDGSNYKTIFEEFLNMIKGLREIQNTTADIKSQMNQIDA